MSGINFIEARGSRLGDELAAAAAINSPAAQEKVRAGSRQTVASGKRLMRTSKFKGSAGQDPRGRYGRQQNAL